MLSTADHAAHLQAKVQQATDFQACKLEAHIIAATVLQQRNPVGRPPKAKPAQPAAVATLKKADRIKGHHVTTILS